MHALRTGRGLPFSMERPQVEPDTAENVYCSTYFDSHQHEDPQDSTKRKQKMESTSNSFLSPHSVPIRPYSPDTLSILSSADEYDHLSPSGNPTSYRTRKPKPTSSLHNLRSHSRKFWIRNKGLFYMLLAQFFGCLMNITTRLLEIKGNAGKGMGPFQIIFVRMFITSVLASAYMYWKRTPHFPLGAPEVRGLLVARGVGGFFGVFGMYYSLIYLPLADATVINFLAPALACWACSLLINQPFTRVDQLAALVSLVGVVLIARPTALFAIPASSTVDMIAEAGAAAAGNATTGVGGSVRNLTASVSGASVDGGIPSSPTLHIVEPMQRLGAVGFALIGVFGSAGAYTTIRWIGQRAHPLLSVNYFAVWCTIVSSIALIAIPGVRFVLPADVKEWSYLVFLGVCGFTMQFLLAASLSYEKSSRATNMTYCQLLYALAGDKLVFGHTPGIMSIIGSSLIIGSAIVVAVQMDPSRNSETERAHVVRAGEDEESQSRSLVAGEADGGAGHEQIGIEEVQMRTLR